ncbi:MAG TPA: SMP-30/gluconolactonase/LRE family protein [Fimbriimonadaceae bacterium]|nr:SMP-30/gluconolactonase/LRE family protein [Fimbriimonadaceae bacterium]
MDVVADLPLANAECAVWNPIDSHFYWSDIPTGRLFRMKPRDRSWEQVYEAGQQIGTLVVAEDGSLILGLEAGRIAAWKDGKGRVLVKGIAGEEERYNDGIVDGHGRLLFGTMPKKGDVSRLYQIADGETRLLLDNIGESNGMAFTANGRTLYHTDTKKRRISQYDYDPDSGSLGAGEALIQIGEEEGVPDGLTIDSAGCLWSARWGGGCVVRYGPDGIEMSRLLLPVKKVSSVTFGGRDLDLMLVTTAGGDDRWNNGPLAGSVFLGKPGVSGMRPRLGSLWESEVIV